MCMCAEISAFLHNNTHIKKATSETTHKGVLLKTAWKLVMTDGVMTLPVTILSYIKEHKPVLLHKAFSVSGFQITLGEALGQHSTFPAVYTIHPKS